MRELKQLAALTPISEEEATKLLVNKGRPGKDGKDGLDGKDGKDGIGRKGQDGLSITGPKGEKGVPGVGLPGKDGTDGLPGLDATGKQGDKGDTPDHQWRGTKLRFEEPEGEWGKFVDLQGQPGQSGGGAGGGAILSEGLKKYSDPASLIYFLGE